MKLIFIPIENYTRGHVLIVRLSADTSKVINILACIEIDDAIEREKIASINYNSKVN